MTRRRVLFFLRHYNDIDHIVPVIYRMLERNEASVSILVTSDRSKVDDFRLRIIREQFGIPVKWIGDYLNLPRRMLHQFIRWTARRGYLDPIRLVTRAWDRFVHPISVLTSQTVDAILAGESSAGEQLILAFDWINSPKDLNPVKPIIDAAHRSNMPVVALPHGDSPYFNRLFYDAHLNYSYWSKFENDIFDHVVVPNEITAFRYRPYRSSDTLHVLGSPRFNRRWTNILLPSIPEFNRPDLEDRIRIVMFLRNRIFPIFWHEVGRTLSLITQFRRVYLVVKHHTRQSTKSTEALLRNMNEAWSKQSNIEFVSDEVHSSALIQWADLILDLGTSMINEAIILKKDFLALEYLHANVSTAAHFIPSAAAMCRDDLYNKIDLLQNGNNELSYAESERNNFIREMIEVPDEDVLDRYVQFLLDCE